MDFLSRLRNSIRQTQLAIQDQEDSSNNREQRNSVQRPEEDDSESQRSFVLSGNSSSRSEGAHRNSPRQNIEVQNPARRESGEQRQAATNDENAPNNRQMFINRLAQNQRSQRLRAAFLRSLASSRESTYQQFQSMRRLIRLGRNANRESGSDSDRFFVEGSDSSEDDMDSFMQMHAKCEELENDNLLSTPDNILVDRKFMKERLHFNKCLPKQWMNTIILNEIDQEAAAKITSEFGILGLYLYSSLRQLSFFDLEKQMIEMIRQQVETEEYEATSLDFIKPVMLFYLNTIMEFCIDNVQEKLDDFKVSVKKEKKQSILAQMIDDSSSSLFRSPESTEFKNVEPIIDDDFLQSNIRTASTAASSSLLTPTLDMQSSEKKQSEEYRQDKCIENPFEDYDKNQIEDKKEERILNHSIPKEYRFSLSNLQQFMNVAPKINQIRKGIKTMQKREIIIYKILLDIVGSYIRNFHTTLSKEYQKKYLPTVIEFYQKVDAKDMHHVITTVIQTLKTVKGLDKQLEQDTAQLFFIDILQMPRNAEHRERILGGENSKEYYLQLYRQQQMDGKIMEVPKCLQPQKRKKKNKHQLQKA